MSEFDFKSWSQLVSGRFATASDVFSLVEKLEELFAETEELLQCHEEGDRSLIACHAGCQDCCIVNVSVTLLEGIAISNFIRHWDEMRQQEIKIKLNSLWKVIRGLEDDERVLVRKRCAFLDAAGCCTIYPVRPLFCRGVTSIDVAACRAAIAAQVFGNTTEILMYQFQLDLYRVAYAALAAGLKQSGRDGRSFQLSGLVRFLLAHPDQEGPLLQSAALTWDDLY